MTALVSATIREHIEFLACEAEFWMAKAAYWAALGKDDDARRCMFHVDEAEAKAMDWAQRLEAV